MPNVDASRCWSRSSKWCCSATWPLAWPLCNVGLLPGGDPGVRRVLVRLLLDHHRIVEIVGRRRRGGFPLEPLRAPRIGPRLPAVEQRVEEVAERQHVADAE